MGDLYTIIPYVLQIAVCSYIIRPIQMFIGGGMAEFPVRDISPNKVIFQEGAYGDAAYILKAGRVEISTEVRGKKVQLAVLTPITIFGEMALLSKDQKRTATATTLDAVQVVEIDRESFERIVSSSSSVVVSVLHALVQRLKETNLKVSSRAPDVFLGTCEILALLAGREGEIRYDDMVKSIPNILFVDSDLVKNKLYRLEMLNLIEVVPNENGKKIIKIVNMKTFLHEAKQIQQGYEWKF